jgi:biotin transport system substrate-specific component
MLLSIENQILRKISESNAVQTILGCLLIVLGAQLSIPLNPVPVTLQTMAVLFIGLTMSPRNAVSATILYILAGSMGLPVFTNFASNPLYLTGPTGGYITGFVCSAWAASKFVERYGSSVISMTVACLLGTCITFILGVSWLSTFIGTSQAISLGLLPFVIPGIMKAMFLIALLKFVRKI